MKKENKEMAKQKRAKERAAAEKKQMARTIVLMAVAVAVIAALIIITAIDNGSSDEDEGEATTESTDVSTDDTTYDDDYDIDDTDDADDADTSLNTTEGTVCEEGDTVAIDYVGTIDDGFQFEGGTGSYDLTLGSHSFIDGFEDGLIGHTVGETVTLDLTFPEGYGGTTTNADGEEISLSGVPVTFEVTINGVYE